MKMDMTQRAIEARRAYKREWNRNNRDRVREYQARYWKKKAAEMAAGACDPETAEAPEPR